MASRIGAWRRRFRALSFNQKATLAFALTSVLVAVVSAVVAALALYQAWTSEDLKNTVHELTKLASYSQSQANSLRGQQATMRGQLDAQRIASKELANQAREAAAQSKLLREQLALGQGQLSTAIKSLAVSEAAARREALDAEQEYRLVEADMLPLNLPTEADIGGRWAASMVMINKSRFRTTLEGSVWGFTLTNKPVETRSLELFDRAKLDLARGAGRKVNLYPSRPYPVGIASSEVTPEILNYIRQGYNLIAYAAFSYRDPRGKLHHEYVCRFSNLQQQDLACPTPDPD